MLPCSFNLPGCRIAETETVKLCQLLAAVLAQSCHRHGSVVPLRWQSSATGMAKTWIYRWEITNL
ncbi:MAG: hypothetical protein LUH50_26035 [Bacteroides intestinalis]|nr:hypothetical protein [Bacteroides intestinalis]